MKVIIADKAGMCYGVKRAINLALETSHHQQQVEALGPLVHNTQVTQRLEVQGIHKKDLESITPGSAVIIRSHGTGPETYQHLKEIGCQVVDGTCPFVSRVVQLGLEAIAQGYDVWILGDKKHPEIQGYMAWLKDRCRIIADPQEILLEKDLPEKIAIMAQTTENLDRLEQLAENVVKAGREPKVYNTICSASRERRQAAEALAAKVDLVLVIGGKHSANTAKLGEYCRNIQSNTYVIENYSDIDFDWLKGIELIGITAGASTPEWIIKEVVEKMEEFKDQAMEQKAQNTEKEQEMEANFSDMEAQMGCKEFHPGDVVKGIVVKVSSDEVLVDIGYKSEGIIPAFELAFTKVDPFALLKVGDEVRAEVIKEDREGNIVLSRKNALFEEKIDLLEKAFENGETVTATVIDVVKGGLLVDVGMRGFVPASHIERGFVKDLNDYLKKTLDFKIIELNRGARKVILSRKALLEAEYQGQKESFWSSIQEGEVRKGTVKRLTDFGAFVDIGGCDGLLHVSEMGWGKVAKPSDVVAINDVIDVYVLKVDREKEKVSLSLKQLGPNPWEIADKKYIVGEIYPGMVMRTAAFGAFIQLEPGLEGLAHISQLAKFRVNKVEDILKAGQEIPVKVLEIDMEKKRISLSVKDAVDLQKPESEAEPASEEPVKEIAAAVEETKEKQAEDETETTQTTEFVSGNEE